MTEHFNDDGVVRRVTRPVQVRDLIIGGTSPISVQSMCATKTQDIPATLEQIRTLTSAGADLIRLAIDSPRDVKALQAIRQETDARLVVDIQESYRLAVKVAPYVDKIRYNPGHLHHHDQQIPVFDKVKQIVLAAAEHNCALRVGVNCGSIDPVHESSTDGIVNAMLKSVNEHVEYLERLEYLNFLLSVKSTDPHTVVLLNQTCADRWPDIPLHLGVTEAGLPPAGVLKTRAALLPLLHAGIGETVRVSLTVPAADKGEEITAARQMLIDRSNPTLVSQAKAYSLNGLNIISCPSCARVENEAFVELAAKVKEASKFASKHNITIAVMGCRVNGPGETDHADLGLWCAPRFVNLKRGTKLIGAFTYTEIIPRLIAELEQLIRDRA